MLQTPAGLGDAALRAAHRLLRGAACGKVHRSLGGRGCESDETSTQSAAFGMGNPARAGLSGRYSGGHGGDC